MTDRVIAIDGPSGSGKSTTARAVASRLAFGHLDSGALYRAVTLAWLDSDLPLDGARLVNLARTLPVRLVWRDDRFLPEVAGVDVSDQIRGDRVTGNVSAVAALPEVRAWATAAFRRAVQSHPRGVVADGRDIGTVVFPEARLKVFLTASARARAERRALEDGRQDDPGAVDRLSRDMARRDALDSGRAVAPLTAAPDAVHVDTTSVSFDDQVTRVVALARERF